MPGKPFRVRVGDRAVTAHRYVASRARATLVLAHGAGAGQSHPFMVLYATELSRRGVDVVTFDFPYMEDGRRLPDRAPVLEACWRAVIARVRPKARGSFFIGGKSMGGRIASHVAAADASGLSGLVFLGYPLHPPGNASKLRSEHLGDVAAPMLFCQGTRDAFGTPDELGPIAKSIHRGTEVLVVDGGDHSFAVPKRGGVPQTDVHARVHDAIVAWMVRVSASRATPRRRPRP